MPEPGIGNLVFLLSGTAFAILAAACFSLRREPQERIRWEWLGAYALFYGLHQWMEMIAGMLDLPYEVQGINILLVLSMMSLLEFGRTNYSRFYLRNLPRWLSLGLLIPAVVAALLLRKNAGELAILGILGLSGTALSLAWLGSTSRAGISRFYLRLLAGGLLLALASMVLWEWMEANAISGSQQLNNAFLLLPGVVLAGAAIGYNFAVVCLRWGERAFPRHYMLHVTIVLALLTVILAGGYVGSEYLGNLAQHETQASVYGRNKRLASMLSSREMITGQIAMSISGSPRAAACFTDNSPTTLVMTLEMLDRYARCFNLDICYLMDRQGTVIATSNRNRHDSVQGKNLAFRDYFQQAMLGKVPTSIHIGSVTGTRGLYAAAPVYLENGVVGGVLAVKTDLSQLESQLLRERNVMLMDNTGRIFLSSNPAWLYQYLWTNGTTGHSGNASLTTRPGVFASLPNRSLVDGEIVSFAENSYEINRVPAGPPGWSILSLTSLEPAMRAHAAAMLLTICGVLILLGVSVGMHARHEAVLFHNQQIALESSLREMERILAVVSHDLRSPLAASRANVDYLLLDESLNADMRSCLETIGAEQMRMSDMVTRMLDTIRIRSGAMEWNWSDVPLRETLDAARQTIASLPDRVAEVSVELQMDHLPETMKGDASAIRRLLVNLGANAVRHTRKGAIHLLACAIRDNSCNWLQLEVIDSGDGIDSTVLPLLGKPFAAGARSSSHKGSGLGLVIAAGICAAHGGELHVRTCQGKGTTFTAKLRLDLPAPMRMRGETLIIVDKT